MKLHTDSIFKRPDKRRFCINITNMSINSISHRKRGDQMDFIYKWLEKRLFKKRHEVMKLQFKKIRVQQELERLKEQQEKID